MVPTGDTRATHLKENSHTHSNRATRARHHASHMLRISASLSAVAHAHNKYRMRDKRDALGTGVSNTCTLPQARDVLTSTHNKSK